MGLCCGEEVCLGDGGKSIKPRMESVLGENKGGYGWKKPGEREGGESHHILQHSEFAHLFQLISTMN